MLPAIGDKFNAFFKKDSVVLGIYPYKGTLGKMFTHILRLSSDTKRGYTEMTVHETRDFDENGKQYYPPEN